MIQASVHYQDLQEYYGKILQSTRDLKSKACCLNGEKLPPSVKKALNMVEGEILERFYSCGSPIPPLLEGLRVLDLGCGAGRDVFMVSQLVGESGHVIGVDMTGEQLAVGRRHIDAHMRKFGFQEANVDFRQGYMEDLRAMGIEDESVDLVISNCVLNLSPDKEAVFSEIFRVLKPGGELYFADVFAGRRVPEHLKDDPVLHGECLAGALYREDFRRLLQKLGSPDHRVINSRRIDIDNPEIEAMIGMVDFYSETIRAFKLAALEDICEDYGQVAVYLGTVPDFPHFFDLDDHHRFITGKPMLVCGNTAAMVRETRFGRHFRVEGNRNVHYGPFDCAPAAGRGDDDGGSGGACC